MTSLLIGGLPSGWEATTLGDVCARGGGNIQTGPFGSQLHAADYVPLGIPSIMPQNIGDNRIATDGIARITPGDADRLSRYLVRPGDIVYSRRGDVERRALIRDEQDGWLCGTGCLRLRVGEGVVDPAFAAFYLAHPAVRAWITQHAVGATMPNLNTAILSAVPFAVPPMDEQRRIAGILGALDDKIELNRQMSRTLESIARAVFTSWFVDFDPVRKKMEGGEVGLPPDLATLRSARLHEIAVVIYGAPFASKTFNDRDGRPVLRIRDLATHNPTIFTTEEHPRETVVIPGDIVVGMDGEFRAHIWHGPPSLLNQRVCLFRPKARVPRAYVLESLREPLEQIERSKTGTTVIHLSKADIDRFEFPSSTPEMLRRFADATEPLIDRILTNAQEARTLEGIRHLLVRQLINGEPASACELVLSAEP